jgi:hypothetical protein
MADEQFIPPELKRVEALLRIVALPESKLDRDNLMYQAGWEAALAQLGQVGRNDQPVSPAVPRFELKSERGKATTALATLAAMLLCLFFMQGSGEPDGKQGSIVSSDASEPSSIELVEDGGSELVNGTVGRRNQLSSLIEFSKHLSTGSLVKGDQRRSTQRVDQVDHNDFDSQNVGPLSNFELRNELLKDAG